MSKNSVHASGSIGQAGSMTVPPPVTPDHPLGIPSINEEDRGLLMSLTASAGPGMIRSVRRLIRQHGIQGAHERFGREQRMLAPHALKTATLSAQARFITPWDTEWPASLNDLDQTSSAPPIGLWVRGYPKLNTMQQRVAIIGTRNPTPTTATLTREWARWLTWAGHTIISGGATGIDTAAHEGAVAAANRLNQPSALVFLPCGINVTYPTDNRELFRQIATGAGLLVSEYAPHMAPTRTSFLERNRLVAAFAQTILISQASPKSGTQNTVTWAKQIGRRLHAIPACDRHPGMVLGQTLINEGAAISVTHPRQINPTRSDWGDKLPITGQGASILRSGDARRD